MNVFRQYAIALVDEQNGKRTDVTGLYAAETNFAVCS
jgi:hypothetical protein